MSYSDFDKACVYLQHVVFKVPKHRIARELHVTVGHVQTMVKQGQRALLGRFWMRVVQFTKDADLVECEWEKMEIRQLIDKQVKNIEYQNHILQDEVARLNKEIFEQTDLIGRLKLMCVNRDHRIAELEHEKRSTSL